jgi:hypothetical protein
MFLNPLGTLLSPFDLPGVGKGIIIDGTLISGTASLTSSDSNSESETIPNII